MRSTSALLSAVYDTPLTVHRQRVSDLDHLLEIDDAEELQAVDRGWQTGLVPETLRGETS